MPQPGMKITVDAAMRARDVSRPCDEGDEEAAEPKRSAGKESSPAKRGSESPASGGRDPEHTVLSRAERRRAAKRGGSAS